ncbi:MAG: hypothetical protein U0163_10915 [Gemmatimonadaceae bacterium]
MLRGHVGQLLVIDGTMYLVTPCSNVAYALDLTQPGYPLKWKFRPENDLRATGKACCDVVNRGASFADGKPTTTCSTGTRWPLTRALERRSGARRWSTSLAARRSRWHRSSKRTWRSWDPAAAKWACAGFAADLATGARWRGWNLGPDGDVKVTERFKLFYAQDRPNAGATSWPGDAWKIGGGASWGWGVA